MKNKKIKKSKIKPHKLRYGCWKCISRFPSWQLRDYHMNNFHKPIPLPAPTPKEHVNFVDLVKDSLNTWGKNMDKDTKKSPSMDDLQLGALFHIASIMEKILVELKRTKRIL